MVLNADFWGSRLSYLLIFCGVLTLIGQSFYRLERDKRHLREKALFQKSSLETGLKAKWKGHLLKLAREGRLQKSYKMLWNRQGSRPREPFFPYISSRLKWSDYRKLQTAENKRVFLENALKLRSSWDRVLAIEEWKKVFLEVPLLQSPYEQTLIDSEAKEAYREIFAQFSGEKKFTYADEEIAFDQVFYSVSADASIEAFVPSVKWLKREVLPQFIRANRLEGGELGKTPWEFTPLFSEDVQSESTFSDLSLQFSGLVFLLLGLTVYLRDLRGQKKRVLRRVSFMNQVVHELKTPLTGLKLHLQLLKNGKDNSRNFQALDVSLKRLNRLFDDVVLMNRPYEQARIEELSVETLNQMLDELVDEFGAVEVESLFSKPILANAQRLRVVVRNLVKNGIRYGKKVRLRIEESHGESQGEHHGETKLFVEDEGPGVDFDDRERIFSEFYRSESAKRANADGLGLGLFLVRKMSKEMGVQVSLQNPGKPGAVFQVVMKT